MVGTTARVRWNAVEKFASRPRFDVVVDVARAARAAGSTAALFTRPSIAPKRASASSAMRSAASDRSRRRRRQCVSPRRADLGGDPVETFVDRGRRARPGACSAHASARSRPSPGPTPDTITTRSRAASSSPVDERVDGVAHDSPRWLRHSWWKSTKSSSPRRPAWRAPPVEARRVADAVAGSHRCAEPDATATVHAAGTGRSSRCRSGPSGPGPGGSGAGHANGLNSAGATMPPHRVAAARTRRPRRGGAGSRASTRRWPSGGCRTRGSGGSAAPRRPHAERARASVA